MRLNTLPTQTFAIIVSTGFAVVCASMMGMPTAKPLQPTQHTRVLAVAGGCVVQGEDAICPTGENYSCHDIYQCQGSDDTCDEIWSAHRFPVPPPEFPTIKPGPVVGYVEQGFNFGIVVVSCGGIIPCLGGCVMEPNTDPFAETTFYCPTKYMTEVPDSYEGRQIDPDRPVDCDLQLAENPNTPDKSHADMFAAVNGIGFRLFE